MSSIIKFESVTKTYCTAGYEYKALNEINMDIKQGEFVAIMGESGAGKSTIMNIIGLLDSPSSGQYFLNQKDVSTLDDDNRSRIRNQEIGFVFQSFFLLPRVDVLHNVGLPLIYRGVSSHIIKEKALNYLEKVGMKEYSDRRPNELSGGQQQRVAIARALVGEPSVILADEPTGALDSKTSQEVMDLFININQQEKVTTIIVTHDPEVGKQCQRIITIKDGMIN